jgi:hypothetical protein
MPFRYMVDEDLSHAHQTNEPLMPDGMRQLIQKDLGRSFEF